jgi:uridine phosphorylase
MIMDILEQVIDIIEELYRKGWDERNGGNLSLIISEAEVAKYADPKQVMRSFTYDFDLSPLIGKYFIITGSGKYFRNVVKEPEVTLGIVKIVGEHQVNLVWGFETGAHTFIRVGTCASVSRGVGRGDVIVPTGAVRMEGTSMHFAPLEYPAIPDPEVNDALLHALHEKGYPGKRGVIITRDSFYTQNRAASKPIGYELVNKWNAYKMMGAIATEMEGSPLFIAGASLGVRTGVVLVCATDYEVESDEDKTTNKTYPMNYEARAIEVEIEAMRELILADRKK